MLDLTSGEPTPHGSPEIRAKETAAATAILQLDWRENLGLPNRSLQPTLEARRQLAEVFRRVRPKWLFAPFWIDAHPDHVAATQLVEAARFWSKLTKTNMAGEPFHPPRILYYWCVHLRSIAEPPAFVLDISEQWDRKLRGDGMLPEPIHHRPANAAANLPRPPARPSRLLGLVHRHQLRRTILEPRSHRRNQPAGFCVIRSNNH